MVRSVTPEKALSKRHIGIWLWPNTSDYAGASILKGIQRSNLGSDVRLVVASAPGGDWDSVLEAERRFLDELAEDPVGASAIVWYLGGSRNLGALQRLRKASVPIIFVDRLPPIEFVGDYVGTDNESSAEQAVQHLIDLGHRRVALITNVDMASSVFERERGYHRALRNAGVRVHPGWIQRVAVEEFIGIQVAVDNLLKLEEPPTAIFCVNDVSALRVQTQLNARGIRMPQHMNLVGFDGMLRWLPEGGNLTTACQNFERIGQLAAELAMKRMANGPTETYQHYLLEAPLLVRGSTSPR